MQQFYMNMASQCAAMSRAVRLQVGAVIVKNHNILSFSWNGTPAGWDNVCEHKIYAAPQALQQLTAEQVQLEWPYHDALGRYSLKTKPEVLHAEMNALMKLAKSSESGQGASIFITHAPCMDCAKGIYQSGITEVYYQNEYRCSAGTEFLKKCQLHVQKCEHTQ
jgi:dCMP deaminase